MKPTEKQKEAIEIISNEIKSWKVSNDLNSPTIKSDIKEAVSLLDLDKVDSHRLEGELKDLFETIKYLIQ